eukprot:TRINITY_DN555_c0_g1_i6.p1 TRINITY_DN555_c0_g1~~TRINITY_DN555_c0_g1_i6.p1  ORF type:complete len:528 (+),score=237.89 TRINITY_DN555_c0_g1_i6:2-1585(+)
MKEDMMKRKAEMQDSMVASFSPKEQNNDIVIVETPNETVQETPKGEIEVKQPPKKVEPPKSTGNEEQDRKLELQRQQREEQRRKMKEDMMKKKMEMQNKSGGDDFMVVSSEQKEEPLSKVEIKVQETPKETPSDTIDISEQIKRLQQYTQKSNENQSNHNETKLPIPPNEPVSTSSSSSNVMDEIMRIKKSMQLNDTTPNNNNFSSIPPPTTPVSTNTVNRTTEETNTQNTHSNNGSSFDLSDLKKKLSNIENNITIQPKLEIPTSTSSTTTSLQEEIEKIKQTIKVWSGSPVSNSGKTNSRVVTLVRDPSDIPKYTELQMQQMKKDAIDRVLNEKNFMNEKFLQLQKQYEQELYVNRQFQEAIQEYESTISSLLESHKKQEEKQKLVVSSLKHESENLKLKILDYEKLYSQILHQHNLLKQEQLSKKEKEKEKESQLLKTNQRLANLEQDYQNLKLQYERKMVQANDKIKNFTEQHNAHNQLVQVKLQKNELEIKNLTNQLSLKQKENKELVNLCDDLIKQLEQNK